MPLCAAHLIVHECLDAGHNDIMQMALPTESRGGGSTTQTNRTVDAAIMNNCCNILVGPGYTNSAQAIVEHL